MALTLIALLSSACMMSSTIEEATNVGTPTDDTVANPLVRFQSSGQIAAEAVGTTTITVLLSGATSVAVSVPYTISGTATGGVDYTIATSTLTIPAGQLYGIINVAITNDSIAETEETVVVTLGTPSNAILGSTKVHTLTITTLCDPTITGNYGGGLGSIAEPFAICSLNQWNYFASDTTNWDKSFRLYSDLDFTGISYAAFKMIGNTTTAFTGSFDGNSHTIRNVTLNAGTQDVGLFLQTDGNVTLSNLTLDTWNLTSTGRVGSLVANHGAAGTLTLNGVTASNITLPDFGARSGGLVGASDGPFVASQITLSTIAFQGSSIATGGLIGTANSSCTLSNITGSAITRNTVAAGTYTGGLVGSSTGDFSATDVNLSGLNLSAIQAAGVVSLLNSNASFTRVHVAGAIYSNNSSGGLFERGPFFQNVTLLITESSFNGTLHGGGGAGGLGYLFEGDVSISKSFVKGTITTNSNTVGGLVNTMGNTAGKNVTITDSYVTADLISLDATFGSVSGIIHAATSANLVMSRTYFAGTVTSNNSKSCIMRSSGGVSSLTLNDVYYDSTRCTSSHSDGVGNLAGVTARPTVSFQASTPFSNWLSSIWTFSAGTNPKLAWEP